MTGPSLRASIGAFAFALVPTSGRAQVSVDLVDNGRFEERNERVRDASGRLRIPWWRSSVGQEAIQPGGPLVLEPEQWIEQPLALDAESAKSLAILVDFVQGTEPRTIALEIVDGTNETLTTLFAVPAGIPGTTFTWEFEPRGGLSGASLTPRLVLRLRALERTEIRSVRARAMLPCPSEAELRAQVLAVLHRALAPWLERAIDDVGPRKTGFLCKSFDVVTGEPLGTFPAGFFPLYEQLQDALVCEDVPAWRGALERFLEDFLTLGLDPATGLPRQWDAVKDEPLSDVPVEIALAFGFLIDTAEIGPEAFRARARAAALKIGETVLAKGRMPDGTLAASYVPRDGAPNQAVSRLRRLDVAAPLARLTKLTGDERFVRAAREPLATLEFTHHWSGTWDAIDPGFDDDFGHYGARAVTVAKALPNETAFRRFALEGWKRYETPWRDALRLGGNIAADQVRCWVLLGDLARLETAEKPAITSALHAALRSHWKGEQYGNGAWGDVTIFGFDPKTTLQVGDLPGAPQNLLQGVAALYSSDLGLRTDEVRAMYATLLSSSVATYERPFGFLLDRRERRGANTAAGSLRMLLGLVRMLERLSER